MAVATRAAGACLLLASLGAGVVTAGAAGAAQSNDFVTCDGVDLTIRTNNSNSSDNGGWSSVQVVDGGTGHLIPTSFSGSAFDETAGLTLFEFSSAKGQGNANQNQTQVTCTQTNTVKLRDLLAPGEQPPPGTSLDDDVTFTFTATVVHKS